MDASGTLTRYPNPPVVPAAAWISPVERVSSCRNITRPSSPTTVATMSSSCGMPIFVSYTTVRTDSVSLWRNCRSTDGVSGSIRVRSVSGLGLAAIDSADAMTTPLIDSGSAV
jgi:hypothetical protein